MAISRAVTNDYFGNRLIILMINRVKKKKKKIKIDLSRDLSF